MAVPGYVIKPALESIQNRTMTRQAHTAREGRRSAAARPAEGNWVDGQYFHSAQITCVLTLYDRIRPQFSLWAPSVLGAVNAPVHRVCHRHSRQWQYLATYVSQPGQNAPPHCSGQSAASAPLANGLQKLAASRRHLTMALAMGVQVIRKKWIKMEQSRPPRLMRWSGSLLKHLCKGCPGMDPP